MKGDDISMVQGTVQAIQIPKEIFELLAHEGRITVNIGFPHGIPVDREILISEKFRNAVQKGALKNFTVVLVPEAHR